LDKNSPLSYAQATKGVVRIRPARGGVGDAQEGLIRLSLPHRRVRRRALGWFVAGALVVPLLPLVPQIAEAATITATRDAAAIAKALAKGELDVGSGFVTSAAFDTIPPNGNPAATSTPSLTDFPSDGGTFAILSTGDATRADDTPQSVFASASDGGGNVRGDSDYDVSILRLGLNVPSGANCLQIDFQFLSEEFPEFKGSAYNDAFIAELDPNPDDVVTSDDPWTTSGSTITAPDNFAFDEDGNEISVNSLGETRVTEGQATGTVYDGATAPLVASVGITEPGTHTLHLSLFDQGDSVFDSAVFLDGLRVGPAGPGGCTSGARRQISDLSMTATESTPTGVVESPLGDVPMTGVSQHTETADTATAPFGKAPFGKAPFGKAPFGKAPFGKAPFGKAPFGKAPFGKAPFGKAPFGKAPFGKAALSEYPLLRDGGWPLVLSHTFAYTQATPQSVTWQQLFADPYATDGNPATLPETDPSSPDALKLNEILIGASPLANFPLLAYLLGTETWNDVARPEGGSAPWADEWHTELLAIPACSQAASDLNANPTTFTIAEGAADGCPLENTTLPNHTIGNLGNKPATTFWDLTISELNVKGSFLGDVPLSAIDNPDNVVDCSKIDCNTDTLRDVANSVPSPGAAGAWAVDTNGEATGTFSDLGSAIDGASLSDLAIAFLDPTAVPIEDTPLAEFGFERLPSGNPTNFITYNVFLSAQCLDSAGLKVHATLPPEFAPRPGTSEMSTDGDTYTAIADPTSSEGELTWQLSESEVPLCAAGEIGSINVFLRFDAMPGFTLGTFRSDVRAESDSAPRVDVTDTAPVVVTDSSEPITIETLGPDAVGIGDDSMVVGHLKAEGDVDFYSFTVSPGDSLQVSLSHLSKDYQLVLYAPDGSDQTQSLRPTTPAQELPVGTEPQADPTGTNTGVLPPPALQDIPFVDGKVLSGISDFRGTDPEFLSTIGVAGSGGDTTYVAQVSGANGAHGNQPYVLTVRTFDPIELPVASPVTLPTVSPSGTGMPTVTSTDDTLFLFDYERTAQWYGTTAASDIQASLDALVNPGSGTPLVRGKIVPLDASSNVRNAFTAWDADPANPQKMDDVVRAINGVVDDLKVTGDLSGLKNIVIIGDGSVIPHAAIPDGTADGNEQGFAGDTIFGGEINFLTGALANGYFLSDAPYGALVPLSIKGQLVYLPQVAIGRLGGTVDGTRNDIRDAIDRFIASGGMADPRTATTQPRTAFESDYDWFADGGDVIANALEAQVDEFERLSPNGSPSQPQWTRQEFADAFAGIPFTSNGPAGIVSPNGHFDHYRMLPAKGAATNDESDVYTTADLPSGLSPTIYGSHADLNGDGVVDGTDDSNAFYGETSIIDGGLDCNAWGVPDDGTAGDGLIDGSDDCTLIGYDGTPDGVPIGIVDGGFATADGTAIADGTALPTVFDASTPVDPGVVNADFAWSVINGRVDANGNGTIDPDDCHFDLVGGADVLGSDPACGFAVAPASALDGLVDLDGDAAITSADTCAGCLLGQDVTNGAVNSLLAGRIFFSIGCHFGLDVPDGLPAALAGEPRLRDWAQALAGQGGAVQIGNYGYGIGDRATVGFQEIILGDFAEGLDGSQSVGESLLGAQQGYFGSMPSFTPYDLKILQELATWGMPMYGVPGPTGPATLLSTTSSSPTFTSEPSGISGVSGQKATITSDFDKQTTTETPPRAFFSNDGQTQATHPYPIVPKATAEIPPTSGEVAHGALPLHWNPIQETVIDSGFATGGYAFANATYDSSALEDAPAAKVVYPTTFGNIGTFYGIDGAAHQTLIVLTGQFRSGSGAPQFGTFRAFPSGDWLVLSSSNTSEFLPPRFTSVKVIQTSNTTSTIEVRVDDENGVGRVLAQVLKSDNSYTRVDLTQPNATGDPTLWTGNTTFLPREVTVFAADTNGNVGTANNGGPGFVPQPPETQPVTITLEGAQANGFYVEPVKVSVDPPDHLLKIDGAGTLLPSPQTVGGDGHHTVEAFTPTGQPDNVSAEFDIDTTAPTITINTPALPPAGKPLPMYPQSDGNPALSSPPLSDFSCGDGTSGSGILSCVDQDGNPSGTPLDTSTLGIHTFSVFARDKAGHLTTKSHQYEVIKFTGFFAPIVNPPTLNTAKAGGIVPVKYRLQRLVDGQLVPLDDPTSFVSVTATQEGGVTCQGSEDVVETFAGSSGLQYLGDGNWQFNWATKKSYAGKCFQMNLNLWDAHLKPDGSPLGHTAAYALFKFK